MRVSKLVRRWIGLAIFSVMMATLFISLGRWQWHKHQARTASNAIIQQHLALPAQPFPGVFADGHTILDADQWLRISVTGSYDAAHQFQAMQRSSNDVAGTEVVTPLRTASGLTVLVDRGLLPRPHGQNDPTALPAPPSATVTVVGYVRRDERGRESALTPVDNRMLLISAADIGKQLPYPIVDGYLQLISSDPAQAGGLQPLADPQTSGGPYLSYAIQWFLFTVIGVVGMVMIVRSDLRDRRRADRKAARVAAYSVAHGSHAETSRDTVREEHETGDVEAIDNHSQPEDSHGSGTH